MRHSWNGPGGRDVRVVRAAPVPLLAARGLRHRALGGRAAHHVHRARGVRRGVVRPEAASVGV